MSNLIASQKVIRHYLAALLTEDEPAQELAEADNKKQELNRLLSQVSTAKPTAEITKTPEPAITVVKPVVAPEVKPVINAEPVAAVAVKPPQVKAAVVEKDYRKGRFQALFFEVAGLKVAVPLKELGGIHQMHDINSLFGKPDWFRGVMLYREQKINVVDTARWVMPEKYNAALAEKLNYQYVIMLGTSNWGLSCETLINTIALEQDDVKWREVEGKRPWMAGLIKKHMCVLVDVESFIDLLNRGLNINE